MRRRPALAALLLATSLTLVACGSKIPATPVTTSSTESGIEVSGEFGAKPELEVRPGDPSDDLVVEVLSEGGDEVEDGDYLVADYLGQTWEPAEGGEANVFDNS